MPTKAERRAAEAAAATARHIAGPFVITQVDLGTLKSRVVAGPFDDLAEAHLQCKRHDGRYMAMIDLARAYPEQMKRRAQKAAR